MPERPHLLTRVYHNAREILTPIGRFNRQKERAIENSLRSTFSIITLDRQQRTEEIGSGFAVMSLPTKQGQPGEVIIATNRHVVDSALTDTSRAIELYVVTSGADKGIRRDSLKRVFTNAEIAYVSEEHDLAFIRLSLMQHPDVQIPALRLGYSSLVDVPDTLLNIGAPLGVEDTVTELHVSQAQPTSIASPDGSKDLYRQISIANQGNSGGPVIDPLYAGRFTRPVVVGMTTLGADGNPTVGFMLPAEVIREELANFQQRERGWNTRAVRSAA